jgi:hypothetical protein
MRSVRINTQMEEIVANDLDSETTYTIELSFGETGAFACIQGKLQVLIANKQTMPKNHDESDATLWSLGTSSPPVETLMETAIANSPAKEYTLSLTDSKTDLEVTLDYSTATFAPKLLLVRP